MNYVSACGDHSAILIFLCAETQAQRCCPVASYGLRLGLRCMIIVACIVDRLRHQFVSA